MKLLVIDTTSERMTVAACDASGRLAGYVSENGMRKHNGALLGAIDGVLKRLDMSVNDLDAIGCVIGAGSFTGIRLGVTTAKGLAFAANKPCVAVTAMQEVAYNDNSDGRKIVAIDAGHGNYYGAEFDGDWRRVVSTGNYTEAQLEAADCKVLYKDRPSDPANLIAMVETMARQGAYVELEPLYLKKSQAERERDGE